MRNILVFLTAGAVAACGAAFATSYDYTSDYDFAVTSNSRPSGDTNPMKIHPLGTCKEVGSTQCPHNGETRGDIPVIAKKANGTTISPFPWMYCFARYDAGTGINHYGLVFAGKTFDNGCTWPTQAGCPGEWPATVKCAVTGDNPPGPDNWTGDSASKTVTLAPYTW